MYRVKVHDSTVENYEMEIRHSSSNVSQYNKPPRERTIGREKVNFALIFSDKSDEAGYFESLKNMFYFPTFFPVIFISIYIASRANSSNTRFSTDRPYISVQVDL